MNALRLCSTKELMEELRFRGSIDRIKVLVGIVAEVFHVSPDKILERCNRRNGNRISIPYASTNGGTILTDKSLDCHRGQATMCFFT